MKITLSDGFIKRLRKHLNKIGRATPIEMFIEETVDLNIEAYPWGMGDICVHNEECMHWKSVEDWKKE